MKHILLRLLCWLFFVPLCSGEDFEEMLRMLYKGTVAVIQPDRLAEEMETRRVVLLDARERKEYDVSRLKNAVWIGFRDFDPARVKDIDREETVIIYCALGYRSERIGERLQDAGFVNIRNLYGGIFHWVNQGFPVFDSGGETQNVHAYSRVWGLWLKKGNKVYD